MRTNQDKKKFLEILESETPFISFAAKRAGLDKSTVYRWKKKSRSFEEAIAKAQDKGRSLINDVAESQVVNGVKKGDFKFTRYWLENNNKRYFRPRILEPPGKDINEIKITIVHPENPTVKVIGPANDQEKKNIGAESLQPD